MVYLSPGAAYCLYITANTFRTFHYIPYDLAHHRLPLVLTHWNVPPSRARRTLAAFIARSRALPYRPVVPLSSSRTLAPLVLVPRRMPAWPI